MKQFLGLFLGICAACNVLTCFIGAFLLKRQISRPDPVPVFFHVIFHWTAAETESVKGAGRIVWALGEAPSLQHSQARVHSCVPLLALTRACSTACHGPVITVCVYRMLCWNPSSVSWETWLPCRKCRAVCCCESLCVPIFGVAFIRDQRFLWFVCWSLVCRAQSRTGGAEGVLWMVVTFLSHTPSPCLLQEPPWSSPWLSLPSRWLGGQSASASLGSCGIGAEQSSIGEAGGLPEGCRGGFGRVST